MSVKTINGLDIVIDGENVSVKRPQSVPKPEAKKPTSEPKTEPQTAARKQALITAAHTTRNHKCNHCKAIYYFDEEVRQLYEPSKRTIEYLLHSPKPEKGLVPWVQNEYRSTPFPMKQCGGCGKVYYCTAYCQTANWPSHKLQCKLVSLAPPAMPIDS